MEVLNGGDLDILDEVVAPDVARYIHGHGEVSDSGLDEYTSRLLLARDTYDDSQVTVGDIATEGDVVFACLELQGIHVGQVPGHVPPDY